mgnify:CR=1 FL=1
MTADKIIAPSELILNPDGTIYHLKIRPENLADTILLVGDPQRVELVSAFFDEIEFKAENREIKTHTGIYNRKRITVISTGMGVDNIDIVLNELDALANINLDTRTINPKHKKLTFIRIGTSGVLQPDIPPNPFIVSEFGLGIDGVLSFYKDSGKIAEQELSGSFIAQTGWPKSFPIPYAVKSSESLFNLFKDDFLSGITITAPGFYAPQGRELRLPLAFPEMNKRIQDFSYRERKIINFEMETSALYGLSKLLDHNALTICVGIANRKSLNFNQDYKPAMKKLIEIVFDRIAG